MATPPRPYLSVEQFCELSGLSASTVWRYIRAGKLPYRQPGGSRTRVLIPADALEGPGGDSPKLAEPHDASDAATAPGPGCKPAAPRSGPRPRWTRHQRRD